MSKLMWYYNRLTKMNLFEIIHRCKISIFDKKLSKKDIINSTLLNTISFKSIKGLNFDKIDNRVILDIARLHNGELLIYNKYIKLDMPRNDIYIYNPFTKEYSPRIFFKKINIRGGFDPKPIWEINKQYYLMQLGIAYKKTGDKIYSERAKSDIFKWIDENEGYNTINWCSNLEMAIRNINWIFCLSCIEDQIGDEEEKITRMICRQAEFIYNRLSLYSSANNHLIGELSFLLISGYSISCERSKVWKNKSKKLLEKQIINQFYNDGINKEQSINYQIHTMEFYILCMVISRNYNECFSSKVEEIIKKAVEYIYEISEVNGEIFNIGDQDSGNILKATSSDNDILDMLHLGATYYNDISFINGKDIYFSNKAFLLFGNEYINVLNKRQIDSANTIDKIIVYKQGGVLINKKKIKKKLVKLYFDFGEIGMRPLFAHAHSDILSFNLSVNGIFIFADMGTYKYSLKNGWRDYFRGVYAHNTISIDKSNHFKFLGSFICDKSPISLLKKYDDNDFGASTEAFKSKKCKVSRRIRFIDDYIEIRDSIKNKGTYKKNVEVIFNLDSRVGMSKLGDNVFLLEVDSLKIKFTMDKTLIVNIYKGVYEEKRIAGYQSKSFDSVEETYQFIGERSCDKEIELIHKIEVI